MNLLEAIQNCGENWFRPVGFVPGKAYSINSGVVCQEFKGGHDYGFCDLAEVITGEWEIVTPEQVMKERK